MQPAFATWAVVSSLALQHTTYAMHVLVDVYDCQSENDRLANFGGTHALSRPTTITFSAHWQFCQNSEYDVHGQTIMRRDSKRPLSTTQENTRSPMEIHLAARSSRQNSWMALVSGCTILLPVQDVGLGSG